MNSKELKIIQVKWQDKERTLRRIRTIVFIDEQHVPESMEWDGLDETCVHVIAEMRSECVATGRLLDTGQIGRIAVLKPYRNNGIGSEILNKLISIAETKKIDTLFLNAQIKALNFYRKFDFIEEGDIFDDAGIPHKKMTRLLT